MTSLNPVFPVGKQIGEVLREHLGLSRRQARERNMAVLLITHDLGVVAETCEQVVVMYAGRVVEKAPAASTRAVLASTRGTATSTSRRSTTSRRGTRRRATIRSSAGR
jgi:peptide/nickel transport system ATP-binding protein